MDSATEGDSHGPCAAKGENGESPKCSVKLKRRNKVMSKECITKTPGLEKGALTYCAYIPQRSGAGAYWNNLNVKHNVEFKNRSTTVLVCLKSK